MAEASDARRHSVVLPILIAFAVITTVALVYAVLNDDDIPACNSNDIPAEAYSTISDIQAGGPFEYEDDDAVFDNPDNALPEQDRGFYHTYTVTTPGLGHRGERRIVTGGEDAQDPKVYFYTPNHHESYCEIKNPTVE
nr:Guanyl-specific ribonuclease Sa3 precursor [Streptococcus thermophilus]